MIPALAPGAALKDNIPLQKMFLVIFAKLEPDDCFIMDGHRPA